MLTAVKYLRRIGFGATAPHFFQADDGLRYVVKLQSNPLGPKALANEWLAAQIGGRMELRFPPSDKIYLSDTLIQSHRRLLAAGATAGWHFASRYLDHVRYASGRNVSKAVNKAEMAGVMLFDHLFHNPDRTKNRRNVLLRAEGDDYRLYAIDHSHLFGRSTWSVESLAKQAQRIKLNKYRIYGVLLKRFLLPRDFRPYIDRVQRISDRQMMLIVREIPWEWLGEVRERQGLVRFLLTRRDMAEQIAARICALIPDVHRRS